ncbi:MAG: NAD(P)/FAD-dependent oxidoreductase [Clostridiales bacterium]|jgi:protoporphyrinogen oxidase|nr:NAD(P)/FAD-dependent oxidoreductase [Clostridiales bacterium]
MNIAIIGAGPTGLTAAYELMKGGHNITVFDKSPRHLGGLASAIPIGSTYIDLLYHHIFTTDTELLNLINELGLSSQMIWLEPKNGMYLNSTLYPFTNPIDLILFPPVSFIGRVRMGLAVLRAKKIQDYHSMEGVTAKDWLIAKTGNDAYDKIWRALLYSKFDVDSENVSAVWIWNKFKLRGSTRSNINKEMLGYLKGGFYQAYKKIEEKLLAANCTMSYEQVKRIVPYAGGKVGVETKFGEMVFDKALFTGAPAELVNICDFSTDYVKQALATKYKANICVTLFVKHKISDYYWVTVAEHGAPFVLFIEHTNLVSDPAYDGKHIIYLSRYIDASDPFYEASDEEIKETFLEYVSRMFTGFRRESIVDSYITRSAYTQPVIGLNHSKEILPYETPVKNLYLASMAQIYPEDRGQNYSVVLGKRVSKIIAVD